MEMTIHDMNHVAQLLVGEIEIMYDTAGFEPHLLEDIDWISKFKQSNDLLDRLMTAGCRIPLYLDDIKKEREFYNNIK